MMHDSSRPVHRMPRDMETWEIIASYRHARQIMSFSPNAQLSHALANFMCRAQGELRRRRAWAPEYANSA